MEEWRGEEKRDGPGVAHGEKQTDNTAVTSIFILWLYTEPVHERKHILQYTLGEMISGFSLRFCMRAHYYSKWLGMVSAG